MPPNRMRIRRFPLFLPRLTLCAFVGLIALSEMASSLRAQENPGQLHLAHLERLLEESGIGVVRDELHRFLSQSEGAGAVGLSELLEFGVRLTNAGKADDAVILLQVAVEAFPESPRARMVLGDAWAAKGDLDRQAAGYGAALEAIDKAELNAYMLEHGGDLPRSAKDVIDNHLAAIGGRAAMEKVQTLEIRYSGHDDNGETSIFVHQYRRPHFVRQYTVGSDFAIVSDGSTAWRTGESGWTALEGSDHARRPDLTHDLIDYAEKGIRYAYLGAVADDGIVFHQLRKTYADGFYEDYFFAAASGLLTRIGKRGVIGPTETHYWDYSAEGDILLAHVFIVTPRDYDGTHGGIVREVTVNPPLADTLFVRR